jgi:hypothetical protein
MDWDRPAEAGRPSCGHCRSLTDLAGPEASERHAEAIAFAERAIELATTLGLPAPALALGLRGSARFALGDAGGLNDTRRALEAALGQGLGRETVVLYNNLAEDLGRAEGPRARLELARQGAAFTQRRGIAEWVQPLGGLTARALADLGRIDEARALTQSCSATRIQPRTGCTSSTYTPLMLDCLPDAASSPRSARLSGSSKR